MTYYLPLIVRWETQTALFHDIVLPDDILDCRVRIHMAPKARSITTFEEEYDTMLSIMHDRLDEHLHMVHHEEKEGSQGDGWIDAQRELNDRCRRAIPAITSSILEHQKTLIDQVIQFWQDEDEFEKYCLDDFFALAEAW